MSTSCFSGGGRFNIFSASDSPRRVSGDTEVISIVKSSSMEGGWSRVGKVGVGGINSV